MSEVPLQALRIELTQRNVDNPATTHLNMSVPFFFFFFITLQPSLE